jgi:hypothetical protein
MSILFGLLSTHAVAMGTRNSIYDENFYFYKVEGQKLKRGQDYGGYDFPEIRTAYPDFRVNSLLPKRLSGVLRVDSLQDALE